MSAQLLAAGGIGYLASNDYEFPLIKNRNMMGRVIEGKVMEVSSEEGIAVMTLDLTSGLAKLTDRKSVAYPDKYAGTFNFPYMTPMSQTNTGFWPSPEPNDQVVLMIDDFNESLSYVQGAVNNPGNGRFSDPTVRNFTLPPDPSVTSPENVAPYNQMGMKNSSSGTYGRQGDSSGNSAAHQSGGRPAAHFQLDSSKFVIDVTDFISFHKRINQIEFEQMQLSQGFTIKTTLVDYIKLLCVSGRKEIRRRDRAGQLG